MNEKEGKFFDKNLLGTRGVCVSVTDADLDVRGGATGTADAAIVASDDIPTASIILINKCIRIKLKRNAFSFHQENYS